MAQYSYCLVDLPRHVVEDCEIRMSGIDGIGIALFGHGISDWSNASSYNSAIAADKLFIVGGCEKLISAEFPDGSVVEIPNPSACGPENIQIGTNYQINITDANVNASNDDFYGSLSLVKGADLILHYCNGEIRVITGVSIVFYTMHASSAFGDRDYQRYSWSARWYQSVKEGNIGSTIYTSPEGIWCST